MQTEIQMLNQANLNLSWFSKNYSKLKEKYEDMFIAVKDQKIIASGKTLDEIKKVLNVQNQDVSEVSVEFVSKTVRIL